MLIKDLKPGDFFRIWNTVMILSHETCKSTQVAFELADGQKYFMNPGYDVDPVVVDFESTGPSIRKRLREVEVGEACGPHPSMVLGHKDGKTQYINLKNGYIYNVWNGVGVTTAGVKAWAVPADQRPVGNPKP